jgi:hypothetical protein
MKKYFLCRMFLLGIMLFLPLLISCANLSFYDRKTDMKNSCIIEFQGDYTITRIISDKKLEGVYVGGFYGKNILVLPAGTYAFSYRSIYEQVDTANKLKRERGESYWYTLEVDSSYSGPVTLEEGKKYKIIRDAKEITVTEMNGKGISSSGVMVAPRFMPVINALGWRYNDGILLAEFGPQLGFSIANNAMLMHITGEATIGMGLFGGENNGFGFPYRLGGSVTSFFGNGKLGLGLGGGVTGQTIMFLGDEGNDMLPKIQVPYIQAKVIFSSNKGIWIQPEAGIWFDYYPTITPIDWRSFGFGLAINF